MNKFFKNINIVVENKFDLKVKMDTSLASIMISNLIKNATFHNIENGEIKIIISENSFKIKNTGNKEKLDRNLIFRRFYKSKSKNNNTGLGLTITKAIANLYALSLSYNYKQSLHCFEINFSQKNN